MDIHQYSTHEKRPFVQKEVGKVESALGMKYARIYCYGGSGLTPLAMIQGKTTSIMGELTLAPGRDYPNSYRGFVEMLLRVRPFGTLALP